MSPGFGLCAAVAVVIGLGGCAQEKASVAGDDTHGTYVAPGDPKAQELLDSICKKWTCRKSVSVRLKTPKGPDFVFTAPFGPPIVEDDTIMVFAGETLNIEADIGPAGPVNLHAVEAIVHPERTITLDFSQYRELKDGTGMNLVVHNPFDKALRYRIEMGPVGSRRLIPTSACPVLPHIVGVENWPYPIVQILIKSPVFLKDSEPMVCAN